jgi:hypothetical protein
MTVDSFVAGPGISPVLGGWRGADLAADPERWRLAVPAATVEDLLRAGPLVDADTVALDPLRPPPATSVETQRFVAEVTRRLSDEPGFVLLTGFPVADGMAVARDTYRALGLLLGCPLPQTVDGEMVLPVDDSGRKPDLPGPQKHRQGIALPFHFDCYTDIIGLLCMRAADVGGLSLLASSKALHDILLTEYPDLLPALYELYPLVLPPLRWADRIEEAPYCEVPVFSRTDGQFAARYSPSVRGDLHLPGVRKLTDDQLAAMDAIDAVLARPGQALAMDLQPGELQLINNFYVLHSRTAFYGTVPGASRLLLRIWLAFSASPALPPDYAMMFSSTAAGTCRGGVFRTDDWMKRFGSRLEPLRN